MSQTPTCDCGHEFEPNPNRFHLGECAYRRHAAAQAEGVAQGWRQAIAALDDDPLYVEWRRQTAPPGHVLSTHVTQRQHYANYLSDQAPKEGDGKE